MRRAIAALVLWIVAAAIAGAFLAWLLFVKKRTGIQ